jgi:DNA-directed RNA polymerase specialized sigma24 family protein
MPEPDWLAARFAEQRSHPRSVAYCLLGSPSEAQDAVQEVWLRLSRADTSGDKDPLQKWRIAVVFVDEAPHAC